MEISVLTPPAVEPVTLVEAKGYMRVTSSSEDSLIDQLVTAARRRVEEATGYAIGEQTRRLVVDRWPSSGALPVPAPPLVSVETVKVAQADGTYATLVEGTDYDVVLGEPGAICLRGSVPVFGDRPNSVQVVFTCGFGAEGSLPLPETLAVAIKSLALHMYDHRTPVVTGTITSEVPKSFDFLIHGHQFRYRLPD